MVCWCFVGDTVSDLFTIQGILNQHVYHSILQRYTNPSGLHLVGLSFVFEQDNDPTHLQAGKGLFDSEGELHQMTWPPQSPNLNPIEIFWEELDHRVKEKQPTSAQHLWELLQDCLKSNPFDYLMKLVEGMPRVCKVVIKAKGGYLKNLKYKIHFDLLNTFLTTSLLFYNVENSKNKEKPLNE